MPRSAATSLENNFIKGLITQSTALSFPENACTETFDCVFTSDGRVSRRLGFELENNAELFTATIETDEVFTEFLWPAVSGDGDISFFVQQQGSNLFFYDVSTSNDISPNKKTFTIDLDAHLASGSAKIPAQEACQYASGNGDLLVTNPACNPIYVTYSVAGDSVTGTSINILIRDFAGLNDGLTINQRVTESVATLKVNNPKHYYNILNQGWHSPTALTEWDAARTDMPSNADQVALYRTSAIDAFDNNIVLSKTPGNSPAPKGHFILNAFDTQRTAALIAEGFTGADPDPGNAEISRTLGSIIAGSGTTNPAAAFDGLTSQTAVNSMTFGSSLSTRIGKNFSATPLQITQAIVYGSNDQGFWQSGTPSTTLTLYGKNGSAPTTDTDGTSLGSATFSDTSDESAGRTIASSDTETFWDYVWIRVSQSVGANDGRVAEVRLFTKESLDGVIVTSERPTSVAFFAGRVFYAGTNHQTINTNIYFSQIIERQGQYGFCYQLNDPTSEDYFDLLSSDGGVIRILEIGAVQRLFATKESVLVFATNGVWLISGSQGTPFKANDYVVKRISNIGTSSPHSFVDVTGTPIWWGEDGIYTVKYNADYGSFEVISLTQTTIDSFINAIPPDNRRYVKGSYDIINKICYWIYNTDEDPSDSFTYNAVLVLDQLTGAFYPWTITEDDPTVRGITFIANSLGNTGGARYTTTIPINASTESLVYSTISNDIYTDWPDHANTSYDSYFITGYKLHGGTQRFFQSNYVFVFLDTEDDASCFMQGIFDFTNSGDSGKWSSRQQIYNDALTYRDVNFRRLKVRGKGRSLQLKFASEDGKPFTVIGWSIWETANAGV